MAVVQLDDFGNMLKKYRQLKKLTQSQLAELIELSQPEISFLESGKLSPSIHMLKNFAKIKGKELVIMFKGTKKKKEEAI